MDASRVAARPLDPHARRGVRAPSWESRRKALEPQRIGDDVGHGLHLLHREIGIKILNLLPKRWSEYGRVRLSAHHDPSVQRWCLSQSPEDRRQHLLIECIHLEVRSHADDVRFRTPDSHLLVDWIFVWKESVHEGLIDNGDSGSSLANVKLSGVRGMLVIIYRVRRSAFEQSTNDPSEVRALISSRKTAVEFPSRRTPQRGGRRQLRPRDWRGARSGQDSTPNMQRTYSGTELFSG
jgi:hypothetical protein